MPDLPPRRRPSSPSWTRPIAERLTPAIKALVIAQSVLFFFYVFVKETREFFAAHLALGPGMLHGEVWQLFTALFIHFDFLGFIFNLIGLWFVGALIERTNGTRRFLQLFFVAGVLSNLAIALIARLGTYRGSDIFDGCSFAILALFVAFGRMYGRTPTQILGGLVMQARHLAMILVAWFVIADLIRGDWPRLAGGLVAAAVGLLMGGGGIRDLLALWKARRIRQRYQVLDGGQSGAPKVPRTKKAKYWN
jgi:membrane associated rhomboid family serine protease